MIGSIPGPVVFGAIFDSTCIYWQMDCGRRGNCWVYDNVHLSQGAVTMAMLGIGLNFIFSLLTWLVYPKRTASEILSSETLTLSGVSKASSDFDESSDSTTSLVKLHSVTKLGSSSNRA